MGILRRIVAYVDLDGSGFEKNAIKVENQAVKMGRKVNEELMHLGAGVVAGFGFEALTRGAIESVKHFHDLGEEFRTTTDRVQQWEAAAKHTGLSAEDVGNAFNKLKKSREAAIGGDAGMINAFGKLGVSLESIRDASVDLGKLSEMMTKHVSGREIFDEEDAAAMELFSKSGAKMMTVIQNLQNAGKVKLISQQEIEEITQLDREITKAEKSTKRVVAGVMAKAWEGLTIFIKGAGIEIDQLRGKITEAEADAKKLDLAVDVMGGGYSKGPNAPSNVAPRNTPTYALVDLHKQDAEIERGRLDLQEKINRNNRAALTTTQQIAELKKEIASDEDKAVRAMYEGNDIESERYAKRAEDRRSELIALEHKRGKDLSNDALNRIGVFVGGQERVMAMVQRQHLDVARQTQKVATMILNEMKNSPKVQGGIIE